MLAGDECHSFIALGTYLHEVESMRGYVCSLIFLNLAGGWFPDFLYNLSVKIS